MLDEKLRIKLKKVLQRLKETISRRLLASLLIFLMVLLAVGLFSLASQPTCVGAQCAVCSRWKPLGDPACPVCPPSDPNCQGCCLAYATCTPDKPEPDPATVTPTATPTATPSPTPSPTPLPPTLSGSVSCSLWGENGWCRENAALDLAVSDPQGYAVNLSGDLNGVPFTCGQSCSLPLPEGAGIASYTAQSASGRSVSGSAGWKRDSQPPDLDLSVSGQQGDNGWYSSSVSLSSRLPMLSLVWQRSKLAWTAALGGGRDARPGGRHSCGGRARLRSGREREQRLAFDPGR